MTPSHIEHIGIAVTNLDEAIRYWEDIMGLKCYAIEEVKDQKVKTAFFRCGDVKIELLEPTCPESTIAAFIEKNGGKGGMHHIAFAMENTDQAPTRPRRRVCASSTSRAAAAPKASTSVFCTPRAPWASSPSFAANKQTLNRKH